MSSLFIEGLGCSPSAETGLEMLSLMSFIVLVVLVYQSGQVYEIIAYRLPSRNQIRSHEMIVACFLFEILLMVQKSGDHQLRLVVYPIIYGGLYIPGG